MPIEEAGRAVLIHDRPQVVPAATPLARALAALELVGRDPRQALADADSTVVAARAARHRGALSVALRAAALAHQELGQVPAALADGRESVRVAVRAGDSDLEAEARMSLAFVLLGHGSVAAALRQADRAAALGHGVRGARVATQRALILQRAGRHQEALAGYAQALPVLRRAGDTTWEARLRNNRGLLHAYHGSLSDAETDLRRAHQLYKDNGSGLLAAGAELNLGFVAARRNDAPSALRHIDRADEVHRSLGRPAPEIALDRAEVLIAVGAFGEARRTAARAVEELASASLRLHLAEAQLLLAQAALADGDPEAARSSAQAAAELFAVQGRGAWAVLARYVGVRADERGGTRSTRLQRDAITVADELAGAGWRVHELDMRLTAGIVALDRGDIAVGVAQLTRAGRARRSGPLPIRMRAWYAEALLRLQRGDRSGAERGLRAGMAMLEKERATVGATELRMHVSGHGRDITKLGLHLAVESRAPHKVLAWGERSRSAALRLRPVQPPREREFASALEELRRATAAREEVRLMGGPLRDLEHDVSACEAEVRSLARHASGVWQAPPPAASVDALVTALGSAVLVELLETDDQIIAVTVSADGARLHSGTMAATVATEADALRFALRRTAASGTATPSQAARANGARALRGLRASAAALDDVLVKSLLREHADRPVVLVPTAALHAVPWALLPTFTGRSLTVAPSATTWLQASAVPQPAARVVAVAGPRLRAAEDEVGAVQRLRGALTLVGSDATAGAVLAAMSRADTVHIAAHGHLRGDNPLFSSLELSDGPLTVYDLEQLTSVPSLMILPACRSGAGSVGLGDEVMGLAHALLALGSGAVIAAVVDVPDDGTRTVMTNLHGELARGLRPAAALAAATHPLLQGDDSSADPATIAAAAAFACFGAG